MSNLRLHMRTRLAFAVIGLSCLASASLAQTPSSPAPSAQAEDVSRWRFVTESSGAAILGQEKVPEQGEIQSASTHTVLAQVHSSGVDGIATNYEVNCGKGTIRDLGSTAYAGLTERGKLPAASNEAVKFEDGTIYEAVALFACYRRTKSGDSRIVTGRLAAMEYGRKRVGKRSAR